LEILADDFTSRERHIAELEATLQAGMQQLAANGVDVNSIIPTQTCSVCFESPPSLPFLPPPLPPRPPSCETSIEGSIQISITFRDFHSNHTDFFRDIYSTAATTGMVDSQLDSNGKPVCVNVRGTCGDACPTYPTPGASMLDDCSTMTEWFTSVPGVNVEWSTSLQLSYDVANEAFGFTSSSFFPLDDMLFNEMASYYGSPMHNFFFTSELAITFTYRGGERFDFEGDDDVWVFIDGRLVVDLGGVHPELSGSVIVDTVGGLTTGSSYVMKIFHTERQPVDSNFNFRTTLGLDDNCATESPQLPTPLPAPFPAQLPAPFPAPLPTPLPMPPSPPCYDTPGFTNGQGYGCDDYETQGWCASGGAVQGNEWTLGVEMYEGLSAVVSFTSAAMPYERMR